MADHVSIFLTDDHVVVRKGLKELIERMGNYKVEQEFDNGKELLDSMPFEKEPDILIVDIAMPVMDGKELVKRLREMKAPYPVLILTLDTNDNTIIELFKMGVRGYLPKNCTSDTLKKAINDIAATGYYHNELLSKALQGGDKENPEQEREQILKHITEKEKTFLELVCNAEEYTYDLIAEKMGVHKRTVDGYRESLFDKFNIKSKTGLVLFAIKHRLTDFY